MLSPSFTVCKPTPAARPIATPSEMKYPACGFKLMLKFSPSKEYPKDQTDLPTNQFPCCIGRAPTAAIFMASLNLVQLH